MPPAPYRILIVATLQPSSARDAVAAVFETHGAVDELHILTRPDHAFEFRSLLATGPGPRARKSPWHRLASPPLFGARMIHEVGGRDGTTLGQVADDTLDAMRRLCQDEKTEVIVVAADGSTGLALCACTALQLVGRPGDRFFVAPFQAAVASSGRSGHQHRHSTRRRRGPSPVLMELPVILSETVSRLQSYQELARERRRARRRLEEPGVLVLNAACRVLRIDEAEIALPRLQFYWMFAIASLAPHPLPWRLIDQHVRVTSAGAVEIEPGAPARERLQLLVRHLARIFEVVSPESSDEFGPVLKRALIGPVPGITCTVSRVNKRLKSVLSIGATPYLIGLSRNGEGYGLVLPPARIRTEPRVTIEEA